MIEFCKSSNRIFLEDAGLITTSYSLFKFSTIPPLIPNTPYSNSPKASYVEQAMTGLLTLLGDGVLVKKYEVEELILNLLKVKFI